MTETLWSLRLGRYEYPPGSSGRSILYQVLSWIQGHLFWWGVNMLVSMVLTHRRFSAGCRLCPKFGLCHLHCQKISNIRCWVLAEECLRLGCVLMMPFQFRLSPKIGLCDPCFQTLASIL
eukprot:01642_4